MHKYKQAVQSYKKNYSVPKIGTKDLDKQKKIEEFNKKLNDYDYGFLLNGKRLVGFDLDFNKYKTIDPKDFAKHKVGVCWDYVEYESYYFDKYLNMIFTSYKLIKNNTFSMYYMQHIDKDGDMPTHTWLGYKLNDTIYSFESSWKSIRGIKSHESETKMLDYYRSQQEEYYNKTNNKLGRYIIIKYLPLDEYNLSPDQYMKKVFKTGVIVQSTIRSYPVNIKLD